MTPEGRVKVKVNKALSSLPQAYRFMPVQNGMGAPGLDYYCCIAGRFVAIETKVEGKPLTPRQEITKANIEAAGGTVFVIRTDDDIALMMARLYIMIEFDREHCFVAEAPSLHRPADPGRRGHVPLRSDAG